LIRKGLQPWVDQVIKDSNGTLDIKTFWGGSLVRSLRKQYEATVNGIQDGANILPAYTAKLFPDYTIFSLPYMFPDPDKASIAAWKGHEMGVLGGTEKLKVLAVYTNDNGGIHLSVKLNTLDDLKGKKVRAAGPEEAKVIRLLGGSPVSMGIPAVAESLNRGVITGLLAGWSALRTFRLEPLLKTHVNVPSGVRSFVWAISKPKYDGLPTAARQAIDKNLGLGLSIQMGKLNTANEVRVRKNAADKGKTILTPTGAQETAVRKKLQVLHDEWIGRVKNGQQKYDAMRKLIDEAMKSS
jgi:TRAP-type C4-dicarboxylate transport system substrate-binding protein